MIARDSIRAEAPPSGRRATLLEALEHLHDATDGGPAEIVEVGCARNPDARAMLSDGWATRLFAWYADATGGRLHSIDPRDCALDVAGRLCGPWADSVEFVEARAEDVISALGRIDLLYMDGPPDADVHADIWHAVQDLPRLVLWDDIITPGDPAPGMPDGEKHFPPPGEHPEWAVKGARAIPEMLEEGYIVVFARDRQVLLRRGLP